MIAKYKLNQISKLLFGILLIVVMAAGGYLLLKPSSTELTINSATFRTEEVASETGKQKGLGGRQSIGLNEGMLFRFSTPGQHGIWMKDMKFAIDVLWADHSGQIVHLVDNMQPDSYPEVFRPSIKSSYVLELHTDAIETYNISLGDFIEGL